MENVERGKWELELKAWSRAATHSWVNCVPLNGRPQCEWRFNALLLPSRNAWSANPYRSTNSNQNGSGAIDDPDSMYVKCLKMCLDYRNAL